MENKKKMIYEINGNEIMDKSFNKFLSMIEEQRLKDDETKDMPFPEFMIEMLKQTYESGFEDGCIHIAEHISEIMEGQGSVTVNKN